MRQFLLIYFLLIYSTTYAQTISGIVTEAQTGQSLYPVSVINVSTQQTVYTNQFGAFTINVEEGQQLVFSMVGYKEQRKYITAELIKNGIKVALPILSYELNEFILRPKYTPYQLDSLRRRSTYKRTLAWQRTNSVMSPVSFIADRISKKSRSRLEFQRNFIKWEGEKFIDTRYTPELVSKLTGLTGDSLGHFMNAYPMEYDYARNATELELNMWVRYHYRLWMKNPVIPRIDSADKEVKK
ncbi:MAG: carboxypeptidase-like regulatory domain-containing protein [Flavipsychrobacter sp.]|nr:carboxypeptidase-like regulatory domain-containing protein [Flavipsychrobacter sp.]